MGRDIEGPLAEYSALRQEVTSRLSFMHQIMGLQLTITGTVVAFSLSAANRSDLLLILPWSSYLLCGRYISQEHGIDRLLEYSRRRLSQAIPGSLGWEQWIIDNPRQLTRLGWLIPFTVAFPGASIFALAWTSQAIIHAHASSIHGLILILLWFSGLILAVLSTVTINWILIYRKRIRTVVFSLDPTKRFSALVFDVDGLMIDSERVERNAWQEAAKEFGCTITNAEFSQLIGVSHSVTRSILTSLWAGRAENTDAFDKIFENKVKRASKEPIARKPGLDSLMSWAESLKIPMAIASSTERALVMDRLARSHVNHLRFKVIVCGDDVREVKPAPDIYLLAAKRLRIAPGSCLVLEDSDNGIRAARSAGAISLLIPDLSLRSRDAIPADVVKAAYDQFDSLEEVRELLRKRITMSSEV
jgi:HAD superfamily hydrolase (TIGR01509 family)